ncbi:hypothetical protein GJ496_006210 [Pomphorhynchus laevis]|nr:hypothetical protein GJ496_006210 [Pomphorhynchus laevis]
MFNWRLSRHRGAKSNSNRRLSSDTAMSRFGNIATKCISPDNGDILGGGFFNLKGFYEPQQYSIVLRRCDEGYELTNALLRMYEERAEIEQRYTEDLRSWVHRWKSYLDKSNEYGTNKAAWYAVVNSSDKDAEMHTNMRYRLFNDVINKVEQFKKEKYSRSLTARVKKSKEFEREFEACQKPWLKLLAKIENSKRDYHASLRKLNHGHNVEKTVHTDVGSTEEQRKKITEKVDICRKEMEFARDRYRQNLRDADDYKERYVNAMNCVFEKCQLFERSRLDFFRESFESYVDVIMQVKEADIKRSALIAKEGIQLHDSAKDLEWWSCTYGLGTANLTKWPQFEECKDRLCETLSQAISQKPDF